MYHSTVFRKQGFFWFHIFMSDCGLLTPSSHSWGQLCQGIVGKCISRLQAKQNML